MQKQQTLLSLSIAVSVVSGVLYLIGYWRSFGINVFEFVAFSDILISAVVPLSAIIIGYNHPISVAANYIYSSVPVVFA